MRLDPAVREADLRVSCAPPTVNHGRLSSDPQAYFRTLLAARADGNSVLVRQLWKRDNSCFALGTLNHRAWMCPRVCDRWERTVAILFCNCAYKDIIPEETKSAVSSGLADPGVEVLGVPDLCELAAARDPRLQKVCKGKELTIIACYPRAIRWLLRWAGVDLDTEGVRVLNMRSSGADEILAQCLPGSAGPGSGGEFEGLGTRGDWVPWFPIIDYNRCKNCKQCLSFCPFGVYALSEERAVEVRNPRSCKDNCPACARMCPEVAIIFPKVKDTPINGAPVVNEDVARRRASEIGKQINGGGDIHALLAQRRERAQARKTS